MKVISPPEERIVAYKGVIYELSVNLAESTGGKEEGGGGGGEHGSKQVTKIRNVELQEELTQIVKCMVKTSEESEEPVYSDNFSVTLSKEPCFLGRKYKFRSSVDSSPMRISENKLVFTVTLLPCGQEKNKSCGPSPKEKAMIGSPAPLLTPICSTPPTTPRKGSKGSDVKDMSSLMDKCFELRVEPPITPGFYSEDIRVFKKVVNRRRKGERRGNEVEKDEEDEGDEVVKFDLGNDKSDEGNDADVDGDDDDSDRIEENGDGINSEGNSLLLYTPIVKKSDGDGDDEVTLIEDTPEKKLLEDENQNNQIENENEKNEKNVNEEKVNEEKVVEEKMKDDEEEEEESKMIIDEDEDNDIDLNVKEEGNFNNENNDSMELYTPIQRTKINSNSSPSSSSSSSNKKRTNGNKGSGFFRSLVEMIKKYFPINLLKDN